MTGIDEVILCDSKAKNVGITCPAPTGATVITRLFNEVNVQKNESKRAGYFITIPKSKITDCNAAFFVTVNSFKFDDFVFENLYNWLH